MKIIFLDVDGVLNCCYTKKRTPNGFIGVEEENIARLRQIVDATGAKIVLVSSWKSMWEKDEAECDIDAVYLNAMLKKHSLYICAKTEDREYDRGHGIKKFLDGIVNGCVESFVILDDDFFADYEELGLLPFVVQPSYYKCGLEDCHVDQAIQILMKE